jgi:hypothetical protein
MTISSCRKLAMPPLCVHLKVKCAVDVPRLGYDECRFAAGFTKLFCAAQNAEL